MFFEFAIFMKFRECITYTTPSKQNNAGPPQNKLPRRDVISLPQFIAFTIAKFVKETRILAVLFLGVFLGALDISITGPALPAVGKALGMDGTGLSLIFTLYVLANISAVPFMARLSDVYGRRVVFTTGVLVFTIASGLTAFASESLWMLVGRAIQGLGAAGIFPVATALIGDVFSAERRGRALGILGAVFALAFLLGPPLAGILLKYLSWRWLFGINIPLGLAVAAVSFWILPDGKVRSIPVFNIKGILLMAVFLSLFTLSFTYPVQLTDGMFSTKLVFPVFALVSLWLLLRLELYADRPVLDIRFLSARQVLLTSLLAVVMGILQSGFVFIPQILVDRFSVEPYMAGFMLIPAILAAAAGAPIGGFLTDKSGPRTVMAWGMGLAAAGLWIFSRMETNLSLFYVSAILAGFGLSVRTALNYLMLAESDVTNRATAQGLLTVFISMGQISGAALLGNLIDRPEGVQLGFTILCLFSIGGFVLSMMLKRKFTPKNS